MNTASATAAASDPWTTNAYLFDLVREMQIELGFLRQRRNQTVGRNYQMIRRGEIDIAEPPMLKPDAQGRAGLAGGGVWHHGGRQWTIAQIAADEARLPVEAWQDLLDTVRERRRRLTATAPEDHPARYLAAAEAAVGEPWSLLVRLAVMTIRPASMYLGGAGEVSGLDLDPEYPSLEPVLCLLATDPMAWLDLLHGFGPQHTLFIECILDWERSGDPGTQVADRILVPTTEFIARAVGRMVPIATMPGITQVDPQASLDDIVLPHELRRQVEGLDVGAVRRGRAALGILLHGPSGTGKTMLAHAIAKRAGVPLVQIESPPPSRPDEAPANWVQHVAAALRRCTVNGGVLFFDEVDLLLTKEPELSRLLLTAMERTPAVVILATNRPESLEPALDRRLPVKLHLGIPGALERGEILRRELVRFGLASDSPLLRDPGIQTLAATFRLSGGTLRNIVRLGTMAAELERRPPVLDDLRRALQQTARGMLANATTSLIAWEEEADEPAEGAVDEPLAADAADEVRTFAQTLLACGAGSGVILAHGPESARVDAAVRALADSLGLPVARGRADESAGPSDSKQAGGRSITAEALRRELGDGAVLLLREDGEALQRWSQALDGLVQSGGHHLVVAHIPAGSVPPWLAAAAMHRAPWARCDRAALVRAWRALGGTGSAPEVRDLGQLRAARQRQLLAAAGVAQRSIIDLP